MFPPWHLEEKYLASITQKVRGWREEEEEEGEERKTRRKGRRGVGDGGGGRE